MNPIPVNLAVEDELSEAVLRRLAAESGRSYSVGTVCRRGGFGYLKNTIRGWNAAAKGVPFVVLTDLDRTECAPQLIRDWLPEPVHPNLLLRIAVREVEAWLLADRYSIATFLRCALKHVPQAPESLADPKRRLVELARESRSAEVRARVAPKRGSTAQQGPEYNACLSEFVSGEWNPIAAGANSASLERALNALRRFQPVWT